MAFGHSEVPEVDYSMYMLMGNEAGSCYNPVDA